MSSDRKALPARPAKASLTHGEGALPRNGFTAQNLWLMRQFFNEHQAKPKLQPLAGEISGSENPPIGIVICRSKTRTVVECALLTATQALGIATYTVTPQLPASYRDDLPSPAQIAMRLQAWAGRDGNDEADAP